MLILVGLGNPGTKYEHTFHNVGFDVVEGVADFFQQKFTKTLFNSEICSFLSGKEKVVLVKPQTFMNNSGDSVWQIVKKYGADPENELVVISDDIDIEPGTIRIRRQSRSSTHNGVKSIVEKLGTNNFCRVKVAIGPRIEEVPLAYHVLMKNKNKQSLEAKEKAISAMVELVSKHDFNEVMQKYSK